MRAIQGSHAVDLSERDSHTSLQAVHVILQAGHNTRVCLKQDNESWALCECHTLVLQRCPVNITRTYSSIYTLTDSVLQYHSWGALHQLTDKITKCRAWHCMHSQLIAWHCMHSQLIACCICYKTNMYWPWLSCRQILPLVPHRCSLQLQMYHRSHWRLVQTHHERCHRQTAKAGRRQAGKDNVIMKLI